MIQKTKLNVSSVRLLKKTPGDDEAMHYDAD